MWPDAYSKDGNSLYIACGRASGKSTLQLEIYKKLLETKPDGVYVERRKTMPTRTDYNMYFTPGKNPYTDLLETVMATATLDRRNVKSDIERVIFNNPATIVLWNDGVKTVVKCQEGDVYDPEKGLAMAIAKRFLGNKGNYCEVFKKWLPEDEKGSVDND